MEDLRADEVQVLEDGKPCAVRSFRLVPAEGGEPIPGIGRGAGGSPAREAAD